MTPGTEARGREGWLAWLNLASPWWMLLAGAMSVGISIAVLSWPMPMSSPDGNALVLKVCRDGTLVLRREDGEFRVMRPGAQLSWRAASDKVCEP